MNGERNFVKLSNLVDDSFTVKQVDEPVFKLWDNEARQMLVSPAYQRGYRKLYPAVTDKGRLDFSPSQLGYLLTAVLDMGKANLIGQTFQVSSNGQTGKDIRYWFKPVEPENKGYETDAPDY